MKVQNILKAAVEKRPSTSRLAYLPVALVLIFFALIGLGRRRIIRCGVVSSAATCVPDSVLLSHPVGLASALRLVRSLCRCSSSYAAQRPVDGISLFLSMWCRARGFLVLLAAKSGRPAPRAVTSPTTNGRDVCQMSSIPRRCVLRSASAERGPRSRARDGWVRDSDGLAFRRAGRLRAYLARREADRERPS